MIRWGALDSNPEIGIAALQMGGMVSYAGRGGAGLIGKRYFGPPHSMWWAVLPLFIVLGWTSAMALTFWAIL